MSDPIVEPSEAPETPTDVVQGEPVDEPLGEGGKKALEAERAARKEAEKVAAEAQARISELERANETDTERVAREGREAAEALASARVEALRFKVAAQHGVSVEDAELFLTGADEEALTRQAQRLSERTSAATPPVPKPDLSQGGTGTPAGASTADQFAAAVADFLN